MVALRAFRSLLLLCLVFIVPFAFAQQTGSISGKVTATDGSVLPGVTVEARSNVMPQPRTTVSGDDGVYRLPSLVPGTYTLTFTLAGLETSTRRVVVLLSQDVTVDAKLGVAGVSENITVTAEASLVSKESTAIQSGLSNDEIQALPIAQEYRDLQKLIPGVSVSQELVRGPSAGGSGQDNVYLFDGVNVTMPLFGVLVAEPATYDISQVTVVKGGAKAVDFTRAGGFSIDTVSKSGTNEFTGQLSYQVLKHGFVADQEGVVNSRFDRDRDWTTVNIGGPILPDRLFFYGSYYRPIESRENQSNLYGPLPEFKSNRNEEFGKLTFTPTQAILVNGSYRQSHRVDRGDTYASTSAGSIGFGYETEFKLGTLDASWVLSPRAFATAKFTDFRNPGTGHPDNFASVVPSLAPGTQLDINNLSTLGLLTVPTALSTNPAQAAFVQAYIDKYGYVQNGVRTGGGLVGFASLSADDDDFFRKNGQVTFDYTLGSAITHSLHVGYQRYIDSEDRFQSSNGWGSITIPGGTVNCPATACGTVKPAFFQAVLSQQTTGLVPTIHSEIKTQNIELNDSILMNNWTFNVGVMASNDTLYGQGLAEADNIAGFVKSPGTKYKMHDTPFSDQIQPRLGATWAYNGTDTVFASWSMYNPAANSDARAASWDRNLIANINAYFDDKGVLLGVSPVASSSGKLFVDGIKPRRTSEILIGTGQEITGNWSARIYGRHRYSNHFWEDTNNDARILFGANVTGIPYELYIPDLGTNPTAANPAGTGLRGAIGSGSSYVIAELDGAFTKYYEASLESDWHGGNASLNASYTWSHYYGNFDQDNSSFNTANDAAIFIGSSNIGDGAGRQLWDNKYGNLRGDRRHVIKLNGTYRLPWNATAGMFGVYQSGQPYQLESFLPYSALTTSTSDTNRYAEPAGRRVSPAHHQVDLKYTQNIPMPYSLNLQAIVDIFNVYDNQTGYNFETRVGTLGRCNTNNCIATEIAAQPSINAPFAKSHYDPRRFQLALRLQF
jgi:carboxypeptidase family protein